MLQTIANIGAIITPIIISIIGLIGWIIKQSIEKKNKIEQDLREERVKIYNEIVNPFIFILSNDKISNNNTNNKSNIDIGMEKFMAVRYKEHVFNMLLFGSDGVVKSFNNLMQFFYNTTNTDDNYHKTALLLLGEFLLEIRKSTGNGNTKLDNLQMLESIITDIKELRR